LNPGIPVFILLAFSDAELFQPGLQSAWIHPDNFGRALRTAYPPAGRFEHIQDVLPLDAFRGCKTRYQQRIDTFLPLR